MMTVEEKRRELFEAKFPVPTGIVWDKDIQGYVGENFWLTDYAWLAFNAALDAIEIELPSASMSEYATRNDIQREYQLFLYWMQQRKGRFVVNVVSDFKQEDVDGFLAFVQPRWEHLKSLWTPFA